MKATRSTDPPRDHRADAAVGGGLRDEIERILIEQSIAGGWVLIYLNVLLTVFFAIVYLTSLRDPEIVFTVMIWRLCASAAASGLLLALIVKGMAWAWRRRGWARSLLTAQELIILTTFGATATLWMSEQDYAANATSVTGISAFGVISGVMAPRARTALITGRLGLFAPLIGFCVITQPPLWGVLASLCLGALIASYGVAFAIHAQHRRQALLATRLSRARSAAGRALRGERRARRVLEEEIALRERFLHAVTHDLRQPLQALTFHLKRLERPRKAYGEGGAAAAPAVAPTAAPTAALKGVPARSSAAGPVEAEERLATFTSVARVCLISADAIIDSVAGSAWLRPDLPPADLATIPLAPLFAEIAAETAPLAEHHGLVVRVAPTSLCIVADRDYLGRVARNLTRNALQHAKGRILIGARRRGRDEVEIAVLDDGPGVPAAMQRKIFEPFAQVPGAARRSEGNVGLGLSIVSELVQRMGGEVSLRSVEGRGTCFAVRLARAQMVVGPDASAVSSMAADRPAGADAPVVLIVDDDADDVATACAAVAAAGGEAAVYDGSWTAAAMRAAVAAPGRHVLLDHHLGPGLTAIVVLDGLSPDAVARVAVMSRDAAPATLAALRRVGAAYLPKPIGAAAVKAILDGSRRRQPPSGS